MNDYILKIPSEHLYCFGDIHGEFGAILATIKRYEIKDSVMVFCGDIGIGFEKKGYYDRWFDKLTKVLSRNNVYVVFIRGNHDDPEYFNGKTFNRKYIKVVKDYTILEIERSEQEYYRILCVGGGISIDRLYRLEKTEEYVRKYMLWHMCDETEARSKAGKLYWFKESPYIDEDAFKFILDNNVNINMVCTHTCPSYAQPITKGGVENWMKYDIKLEEDLNKERGVMDEVMERLHIIGTIPSHWTYGHYHYHNSEVIDGTVYTMLDMCRNGNLDMLQMF